MSESEVGTLITLPSGSDLVPAQVYCTVKEMMDDLQLRGFEDRSDLMIHIKAASDFIQGKKGNFIPILNTFCFRSRAWHEYDAVYIKPLLSLISIINNTNEIVNLQLKPFNRMWQNGPYIAIQQDSAWDIYYDIAITGTWGLYDYSESLNLTVSQTTVSETTLVVGNGSLLSPGMVVLIEDEQELITTGMGGKGSPTASTATSLANGAILETDEEITVDNGSEFHEGEVIQIGTEDLYINKIGGNLLSVGRGWNGTTAADHLNDSHIGIYRTFGVLRGVNGTGAAIHASKDVSQYKVPERVNYLCRQIAALMRMKALSGFSGVTGNSEQGQGRYLSEFPPNQISEVLDSFNTGD